MKNARQWLGRARSIDREIKTLEKTVQETRDQVLSITQNYSSDGAQSTKNPHKFDRLVELEQLVEQMKEELCKTKTEILETINTVPDGRQRTVLMDYYIRGMTLEQTAVEMHYSYANVKKIRAKAIRHLEHEKE